MRAEDLRQWLISRTQDDLPDATNWLNVVPILQAVFQYGILAKECTWQRVVLIPKGEEGSRGIGLVKVLWKAIVSLLNRRLTAAISFHDTLNRFQLGRGTGTAALEANLLEQLTAMREAILFEFILDLWNDYTTYENY